eukprot:PhF_6_TR44179/c0_g1_i2/m.67716
MLVRLQAVLRGMRSRVKSSVELLMLRERSAVVIGQKWRVHAARKRVATARCQRSDARAKEIIEQRSIYASTVLQAWFRKCIGNTLTRNYRVISLAAHFQYEFEEE